MKNEKGVTPTVPGDSLEGGQSAATILIVPLHLPLKSFFKCKLHLAEAPRVAYRLFSLELSKHKIENLCFLTSNTRKAKSTLTQFLQVRGDLNESEGKRLCLVRETED